MSTKTKSLLMLVGTLALGILIGLSAGGPLRRHRAERFMHMPPQQRFAHAMRRILRPSKEQRAAMDKILEAHSEKMTETREQFEAEMLSLMDSVHSDLTAILSEEQLVRLNEHIQKRPMGAVSDRVARLAEELELSDEQFEQVREIVSEMRPLAAPGFSKDHDGRRNRRAENRRRMEEAHRQIEAILTQEQLQRFREMRKHRFFPFGRRPLLHPGFGRPGHQPQPERE